MKTLTLILIVLFVSACGKTETKTVVHTKTVTSPVCRESATKLYNVMENMALALSSSNDALQSVASGSYSTQFVNETTRHLTKVNAKIDEAYAEYDRCLAEK